MFLHCWLRKIDILDMFEVLYTKKKRIYIDETEKI